MSVKSALYLTLKFFLGMSKRRLVDAIAILRNQYFQLESENKKLKEENEKLKSEQAHQKVHEVNKAVNQPTSKKAEWELKGVGNDGKDKKKPRGKSGRTGAGNETKQKPITHKETAGVDKCNICGRDLSSQPALQTSNIRIIEDLPSMPVQAEIIEVKQEKKYCPHCRNVTTASTERAMPGSDIGLNTSTQIIYFWILSMTYSKIADVLNTTFGIKMSTAGLSNHIISIANKMNIVYEEILDDVRSACLIHADESGWRVNGKLCWLWVFGNKDQAFYKIDKNRDSDVVKSILGGFFGGILVVDGWRAYMILNCLQQSCMAHLLRKIRELYKAFPSLESVFRFYIKFRRILRDGETLQKVRKKLGEEAFKRRLQKLHDRMDELLRWKNPNEILKEIIAKVERQRPRILTFVEYDDVPCHNNFAEGLIRKAVVKRKISYGSKSHQGAQAYAILLSISETCRLRKISFIDFMKESIRHYIRTGKPMLLAEYSRKVQNLPLAA